MAISAGGSRALHDHAHKYHVGERVEYVRGTLNDTAESGVYTITRCMPADCLDPQYRVKSADEPHERTMKESQLREG